VTAANAYDDELVGLLSELVAIESYSGSEQAVQHHIADWFRSQSMTATIEDADGGLKNIVVEVEGQPGGPTLWIGGHCDTVGIASDWSRAPHLPRIEDNRLYGLGAMDMKAGLAAAMMTTRALYNNRENWCGKLIFAALADEEAYSRGANAFVRKDGGIDAAIMCEPHFDDVVIGAMGKINLKVEVQGRSAHGSRPEQGVNAITEAARLLVAIGNLDRLAHPDFGKASHCVLDVSSGDGLYEIRVPDLCRFTVNWHFMPGETIEGSIASIERLAADLDSAAQFTVTVGEPRYESFWLGKDHAFVTEFADAYRGVIGKEPDIAFGRGVSDANIFCGRANIPTILFGPSGANMHAGDEWVDLDQLHLAGRLYTEFALQFLKSSHERLLP
jgi:acetylornithine deacetylase/succinyl-diaminopimelate desuccinylase-like protein